MVDLSFDNREGYIWYNGKIVDWRTANVHVLNHGLHYASCVFEGERAYKGKIFESEQHTKRLFDSAKSLDMEIPYKKSDIEEAKKLLADAQLLEKVGCFALVLEKVPAKLAQKIANSITIPVIGIGAGANVDGQVLVLHDMLGMTHEFNPRFLRR